MNKTEIIFDEAVAHPLEEIFDLSHQSTLVEHKIVKTELVADEKYDNKDTEIETQLQEVADAAMGAFVEQQEILSSIEAKFKSRNQEVAVQFLNTALQAIKEKSLLKQHKDKVKITQEKSTKPGVVNNNLIMDRNTLLQMIRASGDL